MAMRTFLLTHWQWVLAYLLLVSLIAFCLMGWDKRQAVKERWRVRERTLLLAAILGGSPGAILGMRVFHHKTKHWYFWYGLPAILLVQLGLAVWAVWPR
jgi:uncharacterized membrane protein YsdA (DUF1294 family)